LLLRSLSPCHRHGRVAGRSCSRVFWGAHAFSVLVIAFCDRELFLRAQLAAPFAFFGKTVSAECRNQHATSVRYPIRRTRLHARISATVLRVRTIAFLASSILNELYL
jgi:hypothetical protein